jgi:hypothetical protein
MKTGCPLIGVCLPSFLGLAGAILVIINLYACSFMVSRPLTAIEFRSFCERLNFDLNLDRFKVLSVRNISPGIFVAVYLIDIRLNVNSGIRHKIQAGLAE